MGLGTLIGILGGYFPKKSYWNVIKNYVKATLKWLRDKVREKLKDKKNGEVLIADTETVKKVALERSEKAKQNENTRFLEELEETIQTLDKLMQEGFKGMLVDIDGNVVGNWEVVQDEDEDVQRLKGSAGYALIKQ